MSDFAETETFEEVKDSDAAHATVNGAHLRSFIERVENLSEEKAAIGDDIKAVYERAAKRRHVVDGGSLREMIAEAALRRLGEPGGGDDLSEGAAMDLPFDADSDLTATEGRVFSALLRHAVASKDAILASLYADRPGDSPDPKIVDVLVCKMRPKLEPFGVEIKTKWGQGYMLDPAVRKRLLAAKRAERAT